MDLRRSDAEEERLSNAGRDMSLNYTKRSDAYDERTSFDRSSSTLGFSVISMYTVPTTQHSSPCRTSSTRSTYFALSPAN